MSELTEAIHSYECEACVDFDQVDYAKAAPFTHLKKLLPAHDAEIREQAKRELEGDVATLRGIVAGLEREAANDAADHKGTVRLTELETAAANFLRAVEATEPGMNNLAAVAFVHGSKYSGPNYGLEKEALRELLAAKLKEAKGDE